VSDQGGTVLEPTLHDASLVSIAIDGRRLARIGVVDTIGVRWELCLEGLEKLRADDFSEGNTILDITMWPFTEADSDYLPALYFTKSVTDEDRLVASRAVNEGWKLVEINASYGCHLVALCHRMTYFRVGQDPKH
jgi:hypothetical protein